MNLLSAEFIIYASVGLLCLITIVFYLWRQRAKSNIVEEKIKKAKEDGLYEPVSLHPVVNPNSCIQTGACISACPEKDILGIVKGKATTINASRCIGHGACFHACPTEAISLCIGTEKRGVDLPHVNQTFETNVHGVFIAGELGGMGLIKNSVEQGKQAVDNIAKSMEKNHTADYDLIIIGAGPAGISASLNAKKHNLKALILEQDTLGGTVFTFPRSKIVMTSPMDLPLHGKVKFFQTSKGELLDLWKKVIQKNDIQIKENSKVEAIVPENNLFKIITLTGEEYTSKKVLLSIGRRGTPRKLNIPGENLENVAYRLLEPEIIKDKNIIVVGGGDSAIESALLLAEQNKVILSYRGETFNRIKPGNTCKIEEAIKNNIVDVRFNTSPTLIGIEEVVLFNTIENKEDKIKNDLIYIFAGGELPTQFLQKVGIQITKKFGEAILKH
ncbi:MAG: NAD(P)-binding domain-containing protein [Bacteroidetes bacterium]|nr:NAD(P)-binding domain-containing protein [Bacteroidota bacterium]